MNRRCKIRTLELKRNISQRYRGINNAINAISNLTMMHKYDPLKITLIAEVQVIDLRLRKKYIQ